MLMEDKIGHRGIGWCSAVTDVFPDTSCTRPVLLLLLLPCCCLCLRQPIFLKCSPSSSSHPSHLLMAPECCRFPGSARLGSPPLPLSLSQPKQTCCYEPSAGGTPSLLIYEAAAALATGREGGSGESLMIKVQREGKGPGASTRL